MTRIRLNERTIPKKWQMQLPYCSQLTGVSGFRPYVLTPESITCLYLMKMKQDTAFSVLGPQFGITEGQASTFFWLVAAEIFRNHRFNIRIRNMSNPQNHLEIMEEARMATLEHGTMFPVVEMMRILMGHANLRSVVLVWDSRDVKLQKITDLEAQKGTYSTKIKGNAVRKIQCSSLDGKAKFIHCLTDSVRYMDAQQVASNNQVVYSFPNSAGGPHLNLTGVRVPPPANVPARVMVEEQANAAKLFCTKSRGCVEQSFLADWRSKICGARYPVDKAYLEECGFNPTPQAPKLFVILMNNNALNDEFGKPFELKYTLPPGMTYRDQGSDLIQRYSVRNWLDKFRVGQGFQLMRNDPFRLPTANHLVLGQQGRFGNLRKVNALNRGLTGFPALTEDDLSELWAGSYHKGKTGAYLTGMNQERMEARLYQNLDHFNRGVARRQRRKNVFIFDQVQQPVNWFGNWNVQGVPWVPCRIARLGGIPSRHKSRKKSTILVAYTLPGVRSPNPFNFRNRNLARIQMFVCGPRNLAGCKPGARTLTPCMHVMSAMKLLGVLSHQPNAHRPCFKRFNRIRGGTRLPRRYSRDIMQGYFN